MEATIQINMKHLPKEVLEKIIVISSEENCSVNEMGIKSLFKKISESKNEEDTETPTPAPTPDKAA